MDCEDTSQLRAALSVLVAVGFCQIDEHLKISFHFMYMEGAEGSKPPNLFRTSCSKAGDALNEKFMGLYLELLTFFFQ